MMRVVADNELDRDLGIEGPDIQGIEIGRDGKRQPVCAGSSGSPLPISC